MVSDIVLLKELPDFIKNSIEAYIGCISGAIIRDKYIEAVKGAGFQGGRIIDEASFPIKWLTNDPTAKALIDSLEIPLETIEELTSSIVSIKVYGVKPN